MPNNPSSERPPFIERLRAESRGLPYHPAKRNKNAKPPPPNSEASRYLFTVFTGNRWMELGNREPAAKMLFGEFWYQHEICFLFASTNTGKSVLAVQIGIAIARGNRKGPFPCQARAARVLYADFELSNLQFHRRYNNNGRDYHFPENFLRAQFNPAANADPDSIFFQGDSYRNDELLIAGLEYRIQQLKATVLIIDNISCLGGGTGNAAGGLRLMNMLNALRTDYKLSILVLAHTHKRNTAHPLSADDLHGSKLLMNFADSAFTIGVSHTDSSLRYLKQIKQRSTEQVYGDGKVCLCRIRNYRNFLKFRFEGHSAEGPHLLSRPPADREQLAAQITQLAAKGYTQRQISARLNIALGTVNKLLRMTL